MKLKDFVAKLQQFDPELEVLLDIWTDFEMALDQPTAALAKVGDRDNGQTLAYTYYDASKNPRNAVIIHSNTVWTRYTDPENPPEEPPCA